MRGLIGNVEGRSDALNAIDIYKSARSHNYDACIRRECEQIVIPSENSIGVTIHS